jgi:hypothetical protein
MSSLREKTDRRCGAGRISERKLLAVQTYLYRGVNRPLARLSVLLSRRGYKKLAKKLIKLINTIERFCDYFSYRKRNDPVRIRKSMLKNGCYVGSGDYYNKKQKN